MSVTIRILKGEGESKPKDLILEKSTILIGRGADQDVRLTNETVSRRHCVIEKADDQWHVLDESSRNNILVNGVKVSERKQLKHGDVLELGEVVCRVGLERPLKDDSKPAWSMPLTMLVNLIAAGMALTVLLFAALLGWMLWKSSESAKKLTAPIEVKLSKEKPFDVFTDRDRAQVVQAVPEEICSVKPNLMNINFTMPEWDIKDVWTSSAKGQAPRLFNGLDLELAGGKQIVTSSYFFSRKTYVLPDAADPYGYLYFELEGWGGFGPRYGVKDIPAIRQVELPHYVRAIDLWPQNIQSLDNSDFNGRELALFWGNILFEPKYGHPLGTSSYSKWMQKFTGPPPAAKIDYQGKYYSFFYNGCRFAAVVRGSSHLLSRFKGGLDKLAEATFDAIEITPQAAAEDTSATAGLAQRARDQIEVLKVFAQKQYLTAGAGALHYNDLNKARNLLLELQRQQKPVDGETELRTLYFNLRDRAQKELELCANSVYEGRGTQKSPRGAQSLQAIRDFLADYNTISMKRGDPRFPEWSWYVEDVSKKSPYGSKR